MKKVANKYLENHPIKVQVGDVIEDEFIVIEVEKIFKQCLQDETPRVLYSGMITECKKGNMTGHGFVNHDQVINVKK